MSGAVNFSGERVFVAGHEGMVGQALVRRLRKEDSVLITASRGELDLRRQTHVEEWMRANRPKVVVIAAAKVGGIAANQSAPAEFLYDNLAIAANLIQAASATGVRKLLFLGSSCIYPRLADQPIREEALLSGPLEPTNQWYAVAKIAGIKLCQAYRRQYGRDFISAQPANLYGPGDNFDLATSHVIPALLRKAHEAKLAGAGQMTVWGSGRPLREFLHVDDLADASVFLLANYSDEMPINVGSGAEVSIADLARKICQVVGFRGQLKFDASKPDGTSRKLLDSSRLNALGWNGARDLTAGLEEAYRWFCDHIDDFRGARAANGGG